MLRNMRDRIVLLENGTRGEACELFDICKSNIKDFTKESVSIFGNIRNPKEGWSVVKTKFQHAK